MKKYLRELGETCINFIPNIILPHSNKIFNSNEQVFSLLTSSWGLLHETCTRGKPLGKIWKLWLAWYYHWLYHRIKTLVKITRVFPPLKVLCNRSQCFRKFPFFFFLQRRQEGRHFLVKNLFQNVYGNFIFIMSWEKSYTWLELCEFVFCFCLYFYDLYACFMHE